MTSSLSLRLLHVHGETPTKFKPHPSYRVVLQEIAAVATMNTFKYWNMKHQSNVSLLTHAFVAAMQLVLSFLGNISLNFDTK